MQFNGSSPEPFEIRSVVKHGCVLAPKLFGIFFDLLLNYNMPSTKQQKESTFVPGKLFNLAGLRAKTKVRNVLRSDHQSEEKNILEQDTELPPVITIDDYLLDAVSQFTYLGNTITDNLSLDADINKRIGKAASSLAHLKARLCTSPKLSAKTTVAVYNACVTSTLLYGSETWTTYAGQERRLNTFHLRRIRRIQGIS